MKAFPIGAAVFLCIVLLVWKTTQLDDQRTTPSIDKQLQTDIGEDDAARARLAAAIAARQTISVAQTPCDHITLDGSVQQLQRRAQCEGLDFTIMSECEIEPTLRRRLGFDRMRCDQ